MQKTVVVPVCLGLTTLQVVWWWLEKDRQFTQVSVLIWVFFLIGLAAYSLLLHAEKISRPLIRFHYRAYSQITGARLLGLGLLFLAVYTAWYMHRVWGRSLVVNDFGSLFYRYGLLEQIFPRLVAYVPMSNGGYDLLVSGNVNLFLLTYPITAFFSVETALKFQPLLLIVLLPALMYLSGRLVGFSHAESFLSSAFALVMTSVGHGGLMEKLFHGTLPYVFSCELSLVVFALSYRVFVLGKNARWGIPLVVLFGSLGLFHPFFFVIIGPLALAVVFFGTIPATQKIVYCVLISVGLVIINGSQIHELLFSDSGKLVGGYINPSWLSLEDWLKKLAQSFLGLQVSLVVAAVVGLGRLQRLSGEPEKRRLGGLLLFAILYYALLTSALHFVAPSLEPIHFVIPLSFFLTLALGPSWSVVQSLWTRKERERSPLFFALNAALVSLVIFLCLPYLVYFTAFPTAPASTYQLVDWLKENASDNGRVFFYRPDGDPPDRHHGLWEGDASFYQAKTKRPTMGHSTIIWPKDIYSWNRDIEECLRQPRFATNCKDLYNIRYAITFSDNNGSGGVNVAPSKEEGLAGFRLVKTFGRAHIHENKQPGSYFLVGHGQVQQQLNRIAVEAEPSEFVVLKFFWVPGLRTDPPLTLEPYPLPNGRAFIKIRSNYHKNFVIFYRWRELANSD